VKSTDLQSARLVNRLTDEAAAFPLYGLQAAEVNTLVEAVIGPREPKAM
jgi:hypothetical protein